MKAKWLLLFVISGALILSGCGNEITNERNANILSTPYSQTEFLMGTVVTVKIYDEGKEYVLEPVFNRIEELAANITVNDTNQSSSIEDINSNAGIQPVQVPDDLLQLIFAGKTYSERANGSFDITIGPLTSLWRIGFPDAKKPEQSEIDSALSLIDYSKIEINKDDRTVFLTQPNMKLDLGAIAKGFIADEVVQILKEHDVTSAIIDLGGNIYVLGENYKGNSWTVGIQDPFSPRGVTIGKLPLSNKSVVTSGIYERYLEADGVQYHHLLDPLTGYPFINDIAGVSVISDYSIDGDALSTILFSKGLQEGLSFAESLDNVEAIFITHNKEVYVTSGLKNAFEITNEQFKLKH